MKGSARDEAPAARVAGVHQVAVGMARGEEKVRLELQMCLGAPGSLEIDEVKIFGVPDLHVQAVGGIHGGLATAAVAVNCVPLIGQAPTGLACPEWSRREPGQPAISRLSCAEPAYRLPALGGQAGLRRAGSLL